jgi:hypothetical protein
VHLFPWNWGCWLEITNLISRIEQVRLPPYPSLVGPADTN